MSQVKIKQLLGPTGSNNGALVVYDINTGVVHWSSDLSSGVLLPTGNTANRPSSPAISTVRFNTDINEAEIYNANGWGPIGSPALFSTLPDGPGSLQANLGLKVNSLGTQLQYYTIVPNTTTFAALVDGPGSLQANMAIKVNSLGTALQYYTSTTTFAALVDGPGSLQANMGIQVNSSATALQYYSIIPGLTTFASLVDGPGSLRANMGIKVNSLGTALQYYTISSGISTFEALTDGPGTFGSSQANNLIQVNSLGSSLQYYSIPPMLHRYRVQINFTSSATYPSSVTVPSGWSVAGITGSSNIATITHNITGQQPYFMSRFSQPNTSSTILNGQIIIGNTVVYSYDTTVPGVFTLGGLTAAYFNSSVNCNIYIDVWFFY